MEHISLYQISDKLQWSLGIIAAINSAAVFLNSSIAVMILQNRTLRTKVSNIFLLFLLLAHFLVNAELFAYCLTYWFYKNRNLQPPEWVGKLHTSTLVGTLNMKSFSIVLITLDRFLSVMRSFVYQRFHLKFALISGIFLFGIGIISVFYQFFLTSSSTSSPIVVSCVIIAQVILCVSNFKIYRIVKQQLDKIKSTTVAPDEETKRKLQQELMEREVIAIKICWLVVSTYLVFMLPLWLDVLFSLLSKNY